MNAKSAQKWVLVGTVGLCITAWAGLMGLAFRSDEQFEAKKVVRLEVQSLRPPQDVANCLAQRSGVGLALRNDDTGYSRGRNVARLILGPDVDADEPLGNGIKKIEVQLASVGSGTLMRLYSQPERTFDSPERIALARCVGIAPSKISSALD